MGQEHRPARRDEYNILQDVLTFECGRQPNPKGQFRVKDERCEGSDHVQQEQCGHDAESDVEQESKPDNALK